MGQPLFIFFHFFKIGSNLQVCTLILLKFDTLVGCIQANSGTNFVDNKA